MKKVVSGQSSVVRRVFSGDPKGSAGEMRNAEFGLRNGGQGNVEKSKIQSPNREVVRITDHAKAYWPNEPIYGEGVVKPSVQEKVERSLRTSPSPSASVDLPHLSHPGGWTMMYLLTHIP
jgi:hypothetical protein